MVEGVELYPEHVALEAHGIDAGFLLGARGGVFLDVVQREIGIRRRLNETDS